LIFACSLFLGLNASGQNQAEGGKVTEPKVVETEEVNGIFEFAGYLGKKLAKEVGNRMNLEESEEADKPEEKEEVKRVKIKIGPIKIERIEGK